MNTANRSIPWAGFICAALVLAVPAQAGGVNAAMVEALKARQAAEAAAAAGGAAAPAGAAPQAQPQPQRREESQRRDEPRRDQTRPDQARPDLRDNRAEQRAPDVRDNRRDRDGDRGGFNIETRPSRPVFAPDYGRSRERSVQRLPPGYRSYYWGGSPYYNYRGSWYRPYGGSYLSIGAPYGLFVSSLPPSYSTVWIGGNRYFVADDSYYLYDSSRSGYVLTQSPYDGERLTTASTAEPEAVRDPVLFVYPTKGQSEKQQADDRYECHRWAVTQTGYDPVDAEYRPEQHAQYDRAITACLTGKGYSVK